MLTILLHLRPVSNYNLWGVFVRHHDCWGGQTVSKRILFVWLKRFLQHTCVVVVTNLKVLALDWYYIIYMLLLSVGNEFIDLLFMLAVVGCASERDGNWHAIGHQNWTAWGDLSVSESTTWMFNFVVMMDSHPLVSFQYWLHSLSPSSSEKLLSLGVADLCPRGWLFFIHNAE